MKSHKDVLMSHKGKGGLLAKSLLVDLLMGMVFIILFSFAFWLIWLTFFREYFDTGIIDNNQSQYMQGIRSAQVNHQRQFHNVDEAVFKRGESVSNCIICHNDLPHYDVKEKRAFLNAHSYFIACEVCHVRSDGDTEVTYRWADRDTGQFINGQPSNYTAKITPTVFVDGSVRSLESTDDKEFVMEYLRVKDRLSKTQKDKAVKRTHKNMIDTPISCNDCHTMEKRSFLPFSQLAYSDERINELSRIEVVGMIKKYEKFFLPHLSSEAGERN